MIRAIKQKNAPGFLQGKVLARRRSGNKWLMEAGRKGILFNHYPSHLYGIVIILQLKQVHSRGKVFLFEGH